MPCPAAKRCAAVARLEVSLVVRRPDVLDIA
jgi:hypothetical protein